MKDDELQQLAAGLDGDTRLVKFPDDLEMQYIQHHARTRLIISNTLLLIGISAFLLFMILDYIAFPFYAAVSAWIIRAVSAVLVVLLYAASKRFGDIRMMYVAASGSMIIVNISVVAIDVIGVNSARYDLPLGSLFVIIFSLTLIRFPFWMSICVICLMVFTQITGLMLFTDLDMSNILRNLLFFSFIILMLLFSSYSTDADSRRIFLLNFIRRKYERSGLKKDNADIIAERLSDYMLSQKPYLDPDLRIEDVARDLHIKRHHLTQIINEHFKKNFFMFVNEFRIREAQTMMSDPGSADKTILRIAYDTGFNSKATFNRIFKSVTGITPKEFRRKW